MEKYDYDFSEIVKKYDSSSVTLEDIINEIRHVSLDMVSGDNTLSAFPDDAITYLYSGKVIGTISAGNIVTELNGARVIDKSAAAYLLGDDDFIMLIENAFANDIQSGKFTLDSIDDIAKGLFDKDLQTLKDYLSKPNLDADDIERAAKIATQGYLFEPKQGAWATISERFVEATPPGSRIECYTPNADLGRTWAQVEVVTALDKLPDTHAVGKTTVGELKELREHGGIEAVYEKMMSDSSDLTNKTTLYLDGDGKVVGAANGDIKYDGDSVISIELNKLEETEIHFDSEGKIVGASNVDATYSGQAQFTTTANAYVNYRLEAGMSSNYKDYDSYTALEKLQAKQYDYEKRLIADMIDRGVTSENGIELLSKEELRNKYSFIGDNVDDGVIKELQLSEYRNKKYGIDSAKDIKIYMDETGNVTVASNQKYASIDIENVEANAKFSTTVDDYLNYTDDAEMKATYNDYELLEGIERVEAKQLDLELRRIKLIVGDIDVSSTTVQKYISASGKSLNELDIVDKVLIKCADGITHGSDDIAQSMSKIAKKCEKMSNVAKKALPIANVVFTGIEIYTTYATAKEYYDKGQYGKAAQTVSNAVLTNAGGWAATEVLAPYLMGLGGTVGGPVGIAVGAVASGFVGYSVVGTVVEGLSDIGYAVGQWLYDVWNDASDARVKRLDPLIVDLNGDGFNVSERKYGVNFDLNSDGFAEKINWTSQDGILAYDINGNGQIDNGREVFGDYHLLANGTRAHNGFEALAQYDTNGDGIIDVDDEIFEKLYVWVDGDADGISDDGELKSLAEMNIVAINLNYEEVNRSTDTEALIGNVATFVYSDSTESEIGEMWVSSDLYDAVETFAADVSETITGLPNVRSYGTVSSLYNAIALDETGTLLNLVESFVDEKDMDARMDIVEDILWFICDAESVSEKSRGGAIDARKLKVIESFMGQNFMGIDGANPNVEAAPILKNAYSQIIKMYCFSMIGSCVGEMVNYISVTSDENGKVTYDTNLFYAQCRNRNWMFI